MNNVRRVIQSIKLMQNNSKIIPNNKMIKMRKVASSIKSIWMLNRFILQNILVEVQ